MNTTLSHPARPGVTAASLAAAAAVAVFTLTVTQSLRLGLRLGSTDTVICRGISVVMIIFSGSPIRQDELDPDSGRRRGMAGLQ